MAEREYFLGPKIGTERKAILDIVGTGWLQSELDQALKTILDLPANRADDLIVKIKVIDA